MWGCGEVWLLMFLEFAWNAWEKRKLGELYKKTVEKNDGLIYNSSAPLK